MTTPIVALALLVAMLGLALVLDRLWLESARLELQTAAESSALAGARELASDQQLIDPEDTQTLVDQAVQSAMMAAVQNQAVGQPVVVNEGDVQFPGWVDPNLAENPDPQATAFPRSIAVEAHRTRFRGNPVALFVSELTRQPYGDAAARAVASISGPVSGVRPLSGSAVPALPLAIWWRDPAGQRNDTWEVAIEQRRGRDEFSLDAETQSVVSGPDGIPELTLRTIRTDGPVTEANVQLIDLGSGFREETLTRQISTGWNSEDLAEWGGELRLSASAAGGSSLTLLGLPQLEGGDRDQLEQIAGQPRIALLYSLATPADGTPCQNVNCSRLVAIRVLKVVDQGDGSCRVTVQPTVMATRMALVDPLPAADEEEEEEEEIGAPGAADAPPPVPVREYVYRLQLTE